MTGTILHREGQSIYDLCLQAYGTLDYLIKFANDNNVTNLQSIPKGVEYVYDKSLALYDTNKNIYTSSAEYGRVHDDAYGDEYD